MSDFIKKSQIILALILLTFFIKGVFLANLFPVFSGQDEARHYNTVQYELEPENKNWNIEYEKNEKIKGDFSTYNYSREIRETAGVINNHTARSEPYDAVSFGDGYQGKGEDEINSNMWSHYNDKYPPDTVGGSKLYHKLAALIEKALSSQSILVRFFAIRIFGILLGTLTIFTCYLIAKTIGFSQKISLLLTAIISFQPGFSVYHISINYDVLLILTFTLFILGAVMSLKDGLNIKNALIMIAAVAVGLFTKATAIILLAAFILLLAYFAFKKFRTRQLNIKNILISLILAILVLSVFSHIYDFQKILPIKKGSTLVESVAPARIGNYLNDSLSPGRIKLTSNSYWGNIGWESNLIVDNLLYIIWAVEIASFLGLIILFFSKQKFSCLPEKKYLFFLLFIIVILQLGIRYADFTIYNNTGKLDLGAPGRYFLPNLVSHIILVFTGLGALAKKEKHFELILKIGLILMVAYSFYIIFDIVIPRFYL